MNKKIQLAEKEMKNKNQEEAFKEGIGFFKDKNKMLKKNVHEMVLIGAEEGFSIKQMQSIRYSPRVCGFLDAVKEGFNVLMSDYLELFMIQKAMESITKEIKKKEVMQLVWEDIQTALNLEVSLNGYNGSLEDLKVKTTEKAVGLWEYLESQVSGKTNWSEGPGMYYIKNHLGDMTKGAIETISHKKMKKYQDLFKKWESQNEEATADKKKHVECFKKVFDGVVNEKVILLSLIDGWKVADKQKRCPSFNWIPSDILSGSCKWEVGHNKLKERYGQGWLQIDFSQISEGQLDDWATKSPMPMVGGLVQSNEEKIREWRVGLSDAKGYQKLIKAVIDSCEGLKETICLPVEISVKQYLIEKEFKSIEKSVSNLLILEGISEELRYQWLKTFKGLLNEFGDVSSSGAIQRQVSALLYENLKEVSPDLNKLDARVRGAVAQCFGQALDNIGEIYTQTLSTLKNPASESKGVGLGKKNII